MTEQEDSVLAARRDTTSSELMMLAAAVFFGLAVRGGVLPNLLAVVVGLIALGFAQAARVGAPPEPAHITSRRSETRLLIVVLLFGFLGVIGYSNSAIGPSSVALERLPGAIWALLGVAVYALRRRIGTRRVIAAVAALTVGFSLVVGISHVRSAEGIGFDVLFLHEQAADALTEGANPYTDAVSVSDGAPTAEPGDEIVGYVYPPATALAYSLGEWSLDDPRYTSLAAWLATLTLLSVCAVRRPGTHLIYLLLLLAALPGWPLVLRAAWTEPFSLALLAAASYVWARPGSSGLWKGLALASKQYFIVAAPLLLLHRDERWLRRMVVAAVTSLIAVGIALVWDADSFWKAAVEFHATTPPRPDSSNVVGLLAGMGVTWGPPTALTVGVGVAVGSLAAARSTDIVSFLGAVALSLASSFFVSSQAFANYWFLVMGICVLALAHTESIGGREHTHP